jgi:hypothetical protein
MGERYLTELADVVRAAGLPCVEVDGWHSRSRSSGGFTSPQPSYIVCHHTASGAASDGWGDANYIATGSDIAPISQLYVNRRGEVWVCAAGACNNAGSGGPFTDVPVDSMNTHSLAIEAGNNGIGEPWPVAQQEGYQRLVQALCDFYAIPAGKVVAHFEWTSRKIDPAGPSRWATGTLSWKMAGFRSDVSAGWPTGAPPMPTPTPPGQIAPYPGEGDYGCAAGVCRAWQDMMIFGGWISDNPANHDGVWGDGMYYACYELQTGFGWSDADGVGGGHTWDHACTRGAPPCPRCGR